MNTFKRSLRDNLLFGLSKVYGGNVPTILMFHSISDTVSPVTDSPKFLYNLLQHLKKIGRRFITMDAVTDSYVKGNPLADEAICLTFDDGYKDNLVEALPILSELQIPATIYVATEPIINRNADCGTPGIPLCTRDELDRLAASPLITIGSHTVNHLRLSAISKETAWKEIAMSKSVLEMWLQRPVLHFSYPYGSFSAETVELVKKAGYYSAVCTIQGHFEPKGNPFAIRRIQVDLPAWLYSICGKKALTVYYQKIDPIVTATGTRGPKTAI